MDFKEYQKISGKTDQTLKEEASEDPRQPYRHDVVPLLGLVGEVGGLLGEYKKRLRDGNIHRNFSDEVAEELGDIMWYVANVANKFNLDLDEIATNNLKKVQDRWLPPDGARPLYDSDLPVRQQIPRQFSYRFEERSENDRTVVVMHDELREIKTGDELTDNAYKDDGYRFHDVMHLAFAAKLGWSPVLRKLLRDEDIIENRPSPLDEAEDGGRGRVVEEAIVAAAYAYASEHEFLEGIEEIDWELLRHIKKMTQQLEVKDRSTWEWSEALLQGFMVWRKLHEQKGGTVIGDLEEGTLEFKA
ncbi:MAG: nucleotide pyrophosphohydrolase [Gammaproteobacteria bacterium]|nr:nucleotide pyrophosphohydrolase [Gammaproteobacteria bacterium]